MTERNLFSYNGKIMDERIIEGEVISAATYPMCLSCVSEYVLARNKWIESGQPDGQEPSYSDSVRPAITNAAAWQQQVVGGQMIMACVALPTCMQHLGVREKTAMERAAGSGLMVPGNLS